MTDYTVPALTQLPGLPAECEELQAARQAAVVAAHEHLEGHSHLLSSAWEKLAIEKIRAEIAEGKKPKNYLEAWKFDRIVAEETAKRLIAAVREADAALVARYQEVAHRHIPEAQSAVDAALQEWRDLEAGIEAARQRYQRALWARLSLEMGSRGSGTPAQNPGGELPPDTATQAEIRQDHLLKGYDASSEPRESMFVRVRSVEDPGSEWTVRREIASMMLAVGAVEIADDSRVTVPEIPTKRRGRRSNAAS